jgi:hypothetical protein
MDKSVKDYMSDIMEVISNDGKEEKEFTKKDDKNMAQALHDKAWKNYNEAKAKHAELKPEVKQYIGDDGLLKIETIEVPEF